MNKRNVNAGITAPLVVALVVLSLLVVMAVRGGSSTAVANNNKLYDEVMAYDFDNEYPQSPDAVLEKYCNIDRFLSGNTIDGFTGAELEQLVVEQRKLFHNELLEINPLDTHIKGYADKIDYLKAEGVRLMQTMGETPRFSDDAVYCSIGVKQYWSKNTQVDMVYNLKKDASGKWKIIGWYINEQKEEQ